MTCPHHTAGKRQSQAWNCTRPSTSRSNSQQLRGNGFSEAERRTGVASWTGIPPHTPFLGATTPPPPRRRCRIVYLSQSIPLVTWGGTSFTLQMWKLSLGEAWKAQGQQCRATLQTSQLFTSISQASQYLGAGGGADGHMADPEAAGGGIHYLDSSHSEI